MDVLNVRSENDRHKQIKGLTDRTLLSLLRTFDPESLLFDSSVQAAETTKPTERDSALVLVAIEFAKEGMRRDKPLDGRVESTDVDRGKTFAADLDKYRKKLDEGKPEPISYNEYREAAFEPSLKRIADRDDKVGSDTILGAKAPAGSLPRPFVDREAFTCSCILSLLNKYPREETHSHVYMEALDTVLRELVHLYGPHYVFGGASLTGTEPHAFVAYLCVRSLKGLEEIVQQRAREHEKLSRLLNDIDQYLKCTGPIYKIYKPRGEVANSFQEFVKSQAAQMENPVGLTALIGTLKEEVLPILILQEPKTQDVAEKLAKKLMDAVRDPTATGRGTVVSWLTNFAELVRDKLSQIDQEIGTEYKDLKRQLDEILKSKGDRSSEPGTDSMALTRLQMKASGAPWRRAFFESMKYDIESSCDDYMKLSDSASLEEIADAISEVGKRWVTSAARTKQYVAKFGKWAKQELNRQITLHALPGRTNFDPVQLAFSLRIYNDLEAQPNKDLVAKGLEIVMGAQEEDGTWPTGAPFVFDRQTLAAVYVANVEIMNALMPLIDKLNTTLTQYHQHADRVFSWLEKNCREVSSEKRQKISGWSTDRLFETSRVDMWVTAAALQFLVSYRSLRQDLLKLEMARKYDFSRHSIEWSTIVDAQLSRPWGERVTNQIYEGYIRPFKETGVSSHSAMVLHGPPGTAKSTLAQAIASELNWSLVTITPSDFVKEGIEQSENKARSLFQELLLLRETVVLFDELDEMLRDRHDPNAEKGIAMLRFLIPGMLPKLQSLKQFGETNRLIFIVATNYKDRLDSAVLRTGRIDRPFAVVPPDEPSRYCLIWNFLQKQSDKRIDKEQLARYLAGKTQGWVYKEIEHLVGQVQGRILNGARSALPGDKELGVKPHPRDKLPGFITYSILEREAALDIFDLYRGRTKASEEILQVLASYGLNADTEEKKNDWVRHVTGTPSAAEGMVVIPDRRKAG
jgi:adenylate kinase family enzyme